MPITAITSQPAANSLNAAYRPVMFKVTAQSTYVTSQPPVVYCDIYFGGVYYKTLSKTLPLASGEWQFDIQDAAQEYLRRYLPPNGGTDLYNAYPAMSQVFCRFRSSGINTNTFIVQEGAIPVQGTGTITPVAGGGTQSNTVYVVNATLQHEDNQILTSHLNSFKAGTWSAAAFPLTHRPVRYRLHLGNSDYFPLAYTGNSPLKAIKVYYRYKGQSTYNVLNKSFDNPCPIVLAATTPTSVDSTNQQLSFTWQAMPYYVTGVKIEYRKVGTTGDPIVIFADPNPTTTPTVTVLKGKYEVWFTAIGNCTGGRTGYNNAGIV